MGEKSILFSTQIVKAILDGRKTMTRRIIKPFKPYPAVTEVQDFTDNPPTIHHETGFYAVCDDEEKRLIKCPYGEFGDLVWVRESFMFSSPQYQFEQPKGKTRPVVYRTDSDADEWTRYFKWKPSIHMPRWASRIMLEITDIRAERLQDITEEDAIKEGVLSSDWHKTYRYAFSKLWDSINGKKNPWSSNPWVFVINFKVVDIKKPTV